jgi:hypothetical protein
MQLTAFYVSCNGDELHSAEHGEPGFSADSFRVCTCCPLRPEKASREGSVIRLRDLHAVEILSNVPKIKIAGPMTENAYLTLERNLNGSN